MRWMQDVFSIDSKGRDSGQLEENQLILLFHLALNFFCLHLYKRMESDISCLIYTSFNYLFFGGFLVREYFIIYSLNLVC
jgi:hypothetical protein